MEKKHPKIKRKTTNPKLNLDPITLETPHPVLKAKASFVSRSEVWAVQRQSLINTLGCERGPVRSDLFQSIMELDWPTLQVRGTAQEVACEYSDFAKCRGNMVITEPGNHPKDICFWPSCQEIFLLCEAIFHAGVAQNSRARVTRGLVLVVAILVHFEAQPCTKGRMVSGIYGSLLFFGTLLGVHFSCPCSL